MRNYQPFNVDGLYNFYRYKMLAYKEWYTLFQDGKLNDIQSQFFKPKSPESLYNIEDDPHETKNLANDIVYNDVLIAMREDLNNHLISINDLSFLPEPYFLNNGIDDVMEYSAQNKTLIKKLIETSNLQLKDYDEVSSQIKNSLNNDNPWVLSLIHI